MGIDISREVWAEVRAKWPDNNGLRPWLMMADVRRLPYPCGPAMRALRKQHLRKQWPGLCDRCSFYEADYHLNLKRIRELRKERENKKKN